MSDIGPQYPSSYGPWSAPSIDPFNDGGTLCGQLLDAGVFQYLEARLGQELQAALRIGFPDYAAFAVPFAVDWMGRIFAGLQLRSGLTVALFDVASDDVIDIGAEVFLQEIQQPADFELLFLDLWKDWSAHSGQRSLDYGQCVGARQPLFAGGDDRLENMELQDVSVYWSVTAPLLATSRGLPEGAPLPTGMIGQHGE